MYKIRELSKIVDIPVRNLRYYDEFEILTPTQIDQFTGYRYYDDESILNVEMIKSLKSVNFTLNEIKEYMLNKDEKIFLISKKKLETIYDSKRNVIVERMMAVGKTTNLVFSFVDKMISKGNNLVILDSREEYLNSYECVRNSV